MIYTAYLHCLKLLEAAGRQLFLYKMFILLGRSYIKVEIVSDTTPPYGLTHNGSLKIFFGLWQLIFAIPYEELILLEDEMPLLYNV